MEALRHWSARHAYGLKRVYDACARCAPWLRRPTQWLGTRRAERLLRPIEHTAKSLLFDCRMCGQCTLSATGMVCPTNCKKQMRNGPCGGVRTDGTCEVDPQMRCVWVEASAGRWQVAGGAPPPVQLLPAIDHSHDGGSSWLRLIRGDLPKPIAAVTAPRAPSPLARCFEEACGSDRFVVTVEVSPPDSADPAALIARAARFKGLVDAINITDGAGGNCHMSSVAASAVLVQHGLVPVYQVACRDRNRIAIQGDLLGAAALGVRNVLCLTGDDVSQGDQPGAKPVFDLDAVTLLGIARAMRDEGVFASGRRLEVAPDLFLGATANPFVPPYHDRVLNLEQKIAAGAQFIQTQFCFDLPMLEAFMREVRARELDKRCRIIVGVGALGSAKALARMRDKVPGVHVPDAVLRRIAAADDQKREGRRVLIETIRALTAMEGVAGVHLMGHRNEETLAAAIIESGVREGAPLAFATC